MGFANNERITPLHSVGQSHILDLVSSRPRSSEDPFEIVRTLGEQLSGVKAATKYDGSPMLQRDGRFMAGIAAHPSAEPETLVIRSQKQNRDLLIAEAPETYYVTDHYRKHSVVLVRLTQIDRDSLRELLTVSWHLTRARSPRPHLNVNS